MPLFPGDNTMERAITVLIYTIVILALLTVLLRLCGVHVFTW